jgi:iron complex transport system ATP-binding protein
MSLCADNLQVSYGRAQRLFDVSLPSINDGDLVGVLGANAAGKSTLLRTLSGQQKYQGMVAFDGMQQRKVNHAAWMSAVGYMPQTPPQETSLRPYELIWSAAHALSLNVTDQALNHRIETLFERLGLSPYAMSPLYALSGGKRQLVGLALALIRQPRLLLLDEPTSALDLHWRMVVLDLVKERLTQQGGVTVAALHDLDLAARYCTKLVMLDQGKVVAAGDVSSVMNRENIARVFKVDVDVEISTQGHPVIHVNKPILD